MVKASCINGHGMWNGEGTPSVQAYRVGFFRDLMKREPDCVIHHDFSGKYPYIIDCLDDAPEENPDIWYCDECGSFAVFTDVERERLDYCPCAEDDFRESFNDREWEEYIVIRSISDDYDAFHDYCEGRNPLDALLTYGFKSRFWYSPDRKYIVKTEEGKGITKIYKLVRSLKL